ncbi:LLM class flavin-dependent oxidoreductase [Microbacterium sp. NPDC089189]|uniref:LLM class flavin-dependent oxidoreductase n=1 Tax=Microbacterium sp. NPDC089189 TaxID=3154972 RepID=UPI00341FD1F2
MRDDPASLSIGVAGALGPDLIGRLAPVIEREGFATLWVNDTPDGDAISALAAAARTTSTLRLATGVVALDRRPAGAIIDELADSGIPDERLVFGIGSGAARHGQLELVRHGIHRLREARPDARVFVGALGPRMRALGARHAHGVLLNWLPPQVAGAQRDEAREVSADAHVAVYVRTALDDAAVPRMREDAERYAGYPAYAANFARLGVGVFDTTLPGEGGGDVAARLGAYRAAADEVVLRAVVAADDLRSYEEFVVRAASLADRTEGRS